MPSMMRVRVAATSSEVKVRSAAPSVNRNERLRCPSGSAKSCRNSTDNRPSPARVRKPCSTSAINARAWPACSGVVLYLGLDKRYEQLIHHNFVFSRDPDTRVQNVGTYRVQLISPTTCASYISNGKQGRIHRDKYQARNEPMPVATALGHKTETPIGAPVDWRSRASVSAMANAVARSGSKTTCARPSPQ